MTQSPPDKMPMIEAGVRYSTPVMPKKIWLLHGTGDDGAHTWCTDPNPSGYITDDQRTEYLNAATLADDLARVEEMMKLYTNPENYEGCGRHDPVVFENGDYGSTAKEALTIIRRLRGSQ